MSTVVGSRDDNQTTGSSNDVPRTRRCHHLAYACPGSSKPYQTVHRANLQPKRPVFASRANAKLTHHGPSSPDDHCALHTFVDSFLNWSEEEWLANRAILLLHPHQRVSLPVNLRSWRDIFCTLGKHKVYLIYRGNSLSDNFSHPFLTTPLTSADVQITIQP